VPQNFAMTPRGPFDLANQRRFFGSWPAFDPDPAAVAMAFPVEGWAGSAVVLVRQDGAGSITGEVHGTAGTAAKPAWAQALAVLSLDIDGSGFAAAGERDPVVGRLQTDHGWMRPTLFHSPYEAACHFVIGQRISIAQARALRLRMAVESGDRVSAHSVELAAFPRPETLLGLEAVRGLPAEKLARLHAVARAAVEGVLDRARLRTMPTSVALAELSRLRGVGPFSAQGIMFRGAGVVDEVTDDPVTKQAVQRLYELDHLPDHEEVLRIAEPWRPYRMWALVLMHVWLRGEGGGPAPRADGRRRGPGAGSRNRPPVSGS
jgi:DNA-3-methyladenine glycosylase II